MKLGSNHNRLVALSALLFVASVTMWFGLEACARQGSDLKIVDLQDHLIVRIDASGSVFDGIDSKIAVINDREGSFTFTKDHQKVSFKHDPAIERHNDRYTVKFGGEDNIIEVKPDGVIFLNGKSVWRVLGYKQNDIQKDRFMAAIVIIPFLNLNMDAPDDVKLILPRRLKNADYDSAIRKESIIWIPSDDEIYVGDERIPKADFYSGPVNKVDEWLKRQPGTNKIIYIAASEPDVHYGTAVSAINLIRAAKESAKQVGLIVEESGDSPASRFLLVIPPQTDPDEELKPNPLLLGVTLSTDLQLKLITGGREEGILDPLGHSAAKGTLNDTSSLSQTLARIFQERKEQHVYKSGMEPRTDLPEDERIEKRVVIRADRSCRYGDVIKIIDVVKGTGANPIILQLDDLP